MDSRLRSIGSREGIHVHSAAFAVKPHVTVNQSENRVVLTESDAFPGVKFCSPLAYDDIPSDHRLASELLNAKTFTDAIPPVFDRSLTFFMSHKTKC